MGSVYLSLAQLKQQNDRRDKAGALELWSNPFYKAQLPLDKDPLCPESQIAQKNGPLYPKVAPKVNKVAARCGPLKAR